MNTTTEGDTMPMDTLALLDPALREVVISLPELAALPAGGLQQARDAAAALVAGEGPPAADGVHIEDLQVPRPYKGGPVGVRLYRPVQSAASPRPAVLHLHGGGYVMGCPAYGDTRSIEQVQELGCIVVSVDYRLAPEHPYPAALEDAYAALRWLHAQAPVLGVDPARVAVAGESAGGGLAAALALWTRDQGGPPLCLQLLDSPMLDDRTSVGALPSALAGQFIWTPDHNRFAWQAYLGDRAGGADVPHHAAAARAADLAGLPPAFISVGALDLFAVENLDYARRLLAAAVPVELHLDPSACHAYMMVPEAQASVAYRRDSLAALRRAFFGGVQP
jgi:acetyl esterase/lipase